MRRGSISSGSSRDNPASEDGARLTLVPAHGSNGAGSARKGYSRECGALFRQSRSCPRNCQRRADGQHTTGTDPVLGRWPEAVTREPGNLLPATSHAQSRRAGCPGACRRPVTFGHMARQTGRPCADGWDARRRISTCLFSICPDVVRHRSIARLLPNDPFPSAPR